MRSFSGLKTGIFRAASAFGVFALTATALVHAQWTITQLTDNSYNDLFPQVSGSNVVWVARGISIRTTPVPIGDLPLRHHNRVNHTTDRQRLLGRALEMPSSLRLERGVDGEGNLDPNDPSTDWEIFHYDITTGSITQLTDNDYW